MALPKRKTSKSRRDKRRTHQKISAPALSKCSQCGEIKLPHHMCPECKTYRGRTIMQKSEKE